MGYLVTAVSTNIWQRQRNNDKSKRPRQLLRSSIRDNQGSEHDCPETPIGKAIITETPPNSARPDNPQTSSNKNKIPHMISDITANLLFCATLLKAQ